MRAYRDFHRPGGSASWTTTAQWVAWADSVRIIPSVAPTDDRTCDLCHGAVGIRGDGGYFNTCQHCQSYKQVLSAVIPIAYSISDGLESALHRYKDWGDGYSWLSYPLGCVTWDFLSRHLECIQSTYGRSTLGVVMPVGSRERTFNHMKRVIDSVTPWPLEWHFDLIRKADPNSDRPHRGRVERDFYQISAPQAVRGRDILLFDDTWTSGSSVASAAAGLRRAGARTVVALTIGRQIRDPNSGWGTSNILHERARSRTYSRERCVICAERT